ncbi:MAG: hypothetical protein ACR2P1_24435 [Pseudomonadales bacterium]
MAVPQTLEDRLAQAMGADLAYVGSAFIATEEANANQSYMKKPDFGDYELIWADALESKVATS